MLSTEHITSMPVVVMGIKNHAQNDVFAQNYSFGVVLTPNSPMWLYLNPPTHPLFRVVRRTRVRDGVGVWQRASYG